MQLKRKDVITAILSLKLPGKPTSKSLRDLPDAILHKALAEGCIKKKKVMIGSKSWREKRLKRDEVFVV